VAPSQAATPRGATSSHGTASRGAAPPRAKAKPARLDAVAVVFGAALPLIGAIQLSDGWQGTAATVILAGAVVLSYASMLLASVTRVPTTVAAAFWLLVIVLLGFVVGDRTGIGWLAALRDGIPRLLTAARPAPATLDLLLPGVMLTVLVGVWVGARTVRVRERSGEGDKQSTGRVGERASRRSGTGSPARTTNGGEFAPLVGAVVLYLGGALLTAGQADPHGVIAAALLLAAMAGWTLTERRSSRRAGRVTTVMAGAALSALAAGLVAVAVLPTTPGFEPRQLVVQPPLPLLERNPLPRLAVLATQDDVMFRHTAGRWRLHLVALTTFDGNSWQSGAVYRSLGVVGPDVLPAGSQRTTVTADVTVEGLKGPWLPAAGVPDLVSVADIGVDAESGSIVIAGGAAAGLRYQVRGTVDTPADDALLVAAVPSVDAYTQVPRLPPLFREYAQQIVQEARTPFEQAVLIESAVREGRRLDAAAPAGSSYARLETFLFGQTATTGAPDEDSGPPSATARMMPGAQAGTSEQFATAFAVLARSVGLPTRVVFGFGPGEEQPDGTWVVRGRDALAWPEVYFAGLGWVPFTPSPAPPDSNGPSEQAKQQIVERAEENQPLPQPSSSHQPPRIAPPTQPSIDPTAGVALPVPGNHDNGPASQLPIFALLVPVILAAFLVLARGVRSQRHRRAGAVGAWSEVLDLLVLVGRRPPPWHTAVRIASDVAAEFPVAARGAKAAGPHPVMRLAATADRAAFTPRGARVEASWDELRRLRLAVRHRITWHRRLTWLLDPRPLWRR
jgi:Transglutaminase-like superfamily/TgpA N-terminal domain